ncbi:MAG TPA: hypothetical protein VF622_20060 [Segetibacter sp.]|jgi:hypothetical protein
MRILLLLTVASFLFWCCSEKNDIKPNPETIIFPKIEVIQGTYLFSKEEHAASSRVSGGYAAFKYIDDKPSKRIGGFFSMSSSSGYSGFYTSDIYDTVQYSMNDNITVLSKDNIDGADIYPSKREFTVEGGLIVKKITYDEVATRHDNDTMHYFYNAEKMLIKTEQHFKYNIITRDYFYNGTNNLQKISGNKRSRIDGATFSTSEELFGGYDNKANPLKGQTLWQDLLYRTLSKNNFTTYTYKSGSDTETRNWALKYDSNGNVDFSK